jgi:hypothetical protein
VPHGVEQGDTTQDVFDNVKEASHWQKGYSSGTRYRIGHKISIRVTYASFGVPSDSDPGSESESDGGR